MFEKASLCPPSDGKIKAVITAMIATVINNSKRLNP
jgi:hypothetical protein